ncbi:aminotransferase class IV [Frondihabitans peucedani]|uniref:Branched-subunit amino acid aminotransferase/4-amino-4-deoxychorismate lyase n=1 Tax=Frondihabitans peucedani TaxID=598626 RepID=A0ABP8DYK7_9MICO
MDLTWADDALAPHSPAADEVVLVSDSWLLDEGRVLAQDVHRDRFLASVERVDAHLRFEAEAFWAASVAHLPLEGRWFPRLRLAAPSADDRPAFELAVRPAPTTTTSLTLVTASHDPRREPLTKGPDLVRLEALRQEARAQGADAAVILSPGGLVVEGDYTSLVWWRGDALCVVDDESARLPGVTERSLVTLATALGVEILRDETDPEGLDGLEVWALNSLHGARIATRWSDGPALAEQPGRLRLWRTRLDALRRPLR